MHQSGVRWLLGINKLYWPPPIDGGRSAIGLIQKGIGDSHMGLVILLFAAPILVSPLFAIEAAWRLISRHSATLRGSMIALATFVFATSIGVLVPLLQSHFGRNENYLAFTFAILQFAIGYFVLAIVFRLMARESSELLGPALGLFSAAFVFPIIFLIFGNELLLRFGISLHS